MKFQFNHSHSSFRSITRCFALLAALLVLSPTTFAADKAKSKAVIQQSVVSINKANAETIANSLKGVGMSKAQAIVAWRKQNGAFKRVEQLLEVKGIGEKILEQNRKKISL